ncbi:hypothetical protein ABBQ38_008448 [Trebouxia sp. C0009 RCD-2024]
MASNDAQASLPSAGARPASALPAQQQTSIPPHRHLLNILLDSTFSFVEAAIGEDLFKLFKAPDDNLTLHAENHTASFPHNSYLDKIIEGAHRRQYSSPYEMMVDVDKMLEYAQQHIASIDSADRQIDVPKASQAVYTAFQTACCVNLQQAINVVKTSMSNGTGQLVGEVMRVLELAPGQDPASPKAMQLAHARKGITTYFLPGTSTPAPQCTESAYNADTCAKHLLFPAQVSPQLSEPDIMQEAARLCQLPAGNGLGIASAQAQAHKKRGRSDVAHLSSDGSQQQCNDPASSCSSPRSLHKPLEGSAAASLTLSQDPASDPQKPKKKRGRPRKDDGYSEKDKKSFDILCKSLEKQKYGISDKGQLDAMWTWLENCKKRPTDFLLKLHDGDQCTSVVQFVSAWQLKWEEINKEKGTGNTKLQRPNPPGSNAAQCNAAGKTSNKQADIGLGTAQHATSNLPASAFRDNDQMRPEAATSNPACCPEAADDNAGPAPVSDTVGTQAAKQLLGPAVIHAKSLQQLADPSPTSQPLVVNDRSIQLAGGILASAHPPAVRWHRQSWPGRE